MSSDYLKARLHGSGSCINSYNSAINKRNKDKNVPVNAIMVYRGTGDSFSLILKDGSRQGSVSNLKPRRLHLREEDLPLPDTQVNKWAPAPVWVFEKTKKSVAPAEVNKLEE